MEHVIAVWPPPRPAWDCMSPVGGGGAGWGVAVSDSDMRRLMSSVGADAGTLQLYTHYLLWQQTAVPLSLPAPCDRILAGSILWILKNHTTQFSHFCVLWISVNYHYFSLCVETWNSLFNINFYHCLREDSDWIFSLLPITIGPWLHLILSEYLR